MGASARHTQSRNHVALEEEDARHWLLRRLADGSRPYQASSIRAARSGKASTTLCYPKHESPGESARRGPAPAATDEQLHQANTDAQPMYRWRTHPWCPPWCEEGVLVEGYCARPVYLLYNTRDCKILILLFKADACGVVYATVGGDSSSPSTGRIGTEDASPSLHGVLQNTVDTKYRLNRLDTLRMGYGMDEQDDWPLFGIFRASSDGPFPHPANSAWGRINTPKGNKY